MTKVTDPAIGTAIAVWVGIIKLFSQLLTCLA
jgi:hypothetical protein